MILSHSAKRAHKIIGEIFKFGKRGDLIGGIAHCLVVYPSAYIANIFHPVHLL